MKDTLQRAADRRHTIKILVAYIRSMRAWIIENDTLYQKERKEIVQATREANRLNKRMNKQLENYRNSKELTHLRETVERKSLEVLRLTKIINQYEMKKL